MTLSPGTIMLTKGGAKLMDFGLAQANTPPPVTGTLSESPAASSPLTAKGAILGTVQYMSPEQLEGKDTDARTDIWALGCVLYEMATGKRAFGGTSQASLIAAVLKEQPRPISELQPLIPSALDRLVLRCLMKDPEMRIQTAHDMKLQLQWTADDSSLPGTSVPAAATRQGRLKWLDGSSVSTLSADGRIMLFAEEGGEHDVNYTVCLRRTDGSPVVQLGEGSPQEISPDGRWALAFVPTSPMQPVLYPTGAGESIKLERGNIQDYEFGAS